jgi:hypothetical protein
MINTSKNNLALEGSFTMKQGWGVSNKGPNKKE